MMPKSVTSLRKCLDNGTLRIPSAADDADKNFLVPKSRFNGKWSKVIFRALLNASKMLKFENALMDKGQLI